MIFKRANHLLTQTTFCKYKPVFTFKETSKSLIATDCSLNRIIHVASLHKDEIYCISHLIMKNIHCYITYGLPGIIRLL